MFLGIRNNKWNRIPFFILLTLVLTVQCSNKKRFEEIKWDKTEKNQYGGVFTHRYTKEKLQGSSSSWYILVTLNLPTFVEFCGKSYLYPIEKDRVGSINQFYPADQEICDLSITIFAKKESLVLNPVVFGEMPGLWEYQFRKDGLILIFGFIYLVMGFFSLYIFFLKYTNLQYLSFALLLFTASVYSISIGNELFGMIFSHLPSTYWIDILLGSLYFFPGVLLWFLSFLIRTRWKVRFRNFGILYIFEILVLEIFLLLFQIEFEKILAIFHFVSVCCLVVFFPPLIKILWNRKFGLHKVLIGLTLFLILAFSEMIISYFTYNLEIPLLSFGLFCFIFPLGDFAVRQYFKFESQLENVDEIRSLRKNRQVDNPKFRLGNLDENQIVEKIKNLMEEDKLFLDETLTLRKLSKKLNIREDQTSFIINHNLKQTFTSLLSEYRVKEAQKLLQLKDVNILNIAYSVGFQSKTAFNTSFKKIVKLTPSDYRRKFQQQDS